MVHTSRCSMQILIVAGFLGSGKTTLILSTIERINQLRKENAAIIVNDFGSVGIDGKIMDKYGLEVQEVMGGCICCSLGSFLLDTVQRIAVRMRPDMMVIEPSGIAAPQQVLDTLEEYQGPPIEFVKTLVVIDAPRYEKVSVAMGRPFDHQLGAADTILINKVDEVDQDTLDWIEGDLRKRGYQGKVVPCSATERRNLDEVVKVMVEP
ncbi:MAG: GTP-binding protein [Methanomassiliicoccales archaeon]